MSLGPSVKDQKKLDDMVNVARAQIDRPVGHILSSSGFQEANYNKSPALTMTTTAASDLNGHAPSASQQTAGKYYQQAQPRNHSKTMDKNHKLLQDFKKKVEQTHENLLRSSHNFGDLVSS